MPMTNFELPEDIAGIFESESTPKPFRMLLYGTAGIGKSSFAAEAPSPLFIQTEDGLTNIDCLKTKLCKKFDDVLIALKAVHKLKGKVKTVVIDTLDWLEQLATAEILAGEEAKKNHYTTLAKFPYGRGGMELIPYATKVLNYLKYLYEEGFNVILIAHSKPEKVTNPDGSDYDQHSPRLNKNINNIFKEWVDVIGFCNYSFTTKESLEKMVKTVKAIETKVEGYTRVINLTGKPSIVAKCRYKLNDVYPLDGKLFFNELLNAIGGGIENA